MLYDEISTCDFIFNVKVNPNGSISGLFFCHQKSVDLARRFNVVIVMDCTYKTNRFGMSLLNIVGITATNNTFNAGFAFICNEMKPMYVYALQSFKFVTKPSVVVTDRELTLMTSIATVLHLACQQKCSGLCNDEFCKHRRHTRLYGRLEPPSILFQRARF